jgi:glycerophosphoryl diester phosphodiesterase
MRCVILLSIGLMLTGCRPAASGGEDGQVDPQTAGVMAPREKALPAWFDCLRENGGLTIAAHRGGPSPGYPENALETLIHNYSLGLTTFEIDVVESRDGVLYLLHDRTLERTTTGIGSASEADWADVAALKLVDDQGIETDFYVPRLSDALIWARETGAILELDRKSSTTYQKVISAVREAGAENNVMLISYSAEQAVLISQLAPDLMLTAGTSSVEDVRGLVDAGVAIDKVIAWSGTRAPDPALWAALHALGVEPAFGTLGRPGQRLDDAYMADGDPTEYGDLAASGLVLLSSDTPLLAAAALTADDEGMRVCGR